MERGFPYCTAHFLGRKKCGCQMCLNELKIRRQNNLIVWGCIAMFLIVVGLGIFSARSAECQRPGHCWGSCLVGNGCGTGPGCACVPQFPNSRIGTCVGG
jgi:hypothetical protein